MIKPLVSVIIPCYNHGQFLDEAIQSILEQSYFDWECIIINDGSIDNTEEIAQKWVNIDHRFIYFYKENGGLSSARNYGIKKSRGSYILTLDADDFYHHTFVEKGVDILLKNATIGIVSSWGIRFSGNEQFGIFKPTGKTIKDFLFYNAAIGTSLFRKECWEKVKGYDENMKLGYEDWEFYIRVCRLGWDVHILEEVLFFYRQHQFSMRTIAINKHNKDIKKYIFIKHKDLYIEYYESYIEQFLGDIESLKADNLKIRNKIDYKLGNTLLRPLRTLKSIFKE
ncbi:glycosyltransferase family 2 protein [Flavobacterium sp. F-65]|uniref:Glycosyltransferase family 2 protein n=1 Tax=Flavobacterium pisciphilum TaxID=2893755 RepID=A0ABS8MUD0_9FLAO|nr:glycosyltransferase family A protein [Flavobacterium sp. F-65]MCC9071702.1 glycosyltransferase family 2 protein [Flavobacterium sp. F-65]